MRPVSSITCLAVIVLLFVPRPGAAQWPPDSFTNLRVLPDTIPPRQLIGMMAGFTRALGVRCTYCHVGEEGRPLATYDFPSDDKDTKRTARAMLRMVQAINAEHLDHLDRRLDPPVRVECATCHRGTQEPRMLQDVLEHAYTAGGIDSALATYRALRQRYYGRFTYDFGEVPLADVAGWLDGLSMSEDALRLYALNVEMNSESMFAKRQHASAAVMLGFRTSADSGTAVYRRLRAQYGATAFPENTLNRVGYALLGGNHVETAIAVFRLNVEAYPRSGNVYDSLGEAYARHGDRELAIENYRRSLELNPANTNARQQLDSLARGNR